MHSLTPFVVLALLALGGHGPAFADKIYFSENGGRTIQRANLDGSSITTVIDATDQVDWIGPLAVAPILGKIYWSSFEQGGVLRRANLDGTAVENLAFEAAGPGEIVFDFVAGSAYFAERSDCSPGCESISRIAFGAKDRQRLFPVDSPYALYWDAEAQRLYWSNQQDQSIQRSNLDGSASEPIIVGTTTFSLTVDPAGGKIYWTDWQRNLVRRANVDGTEIEDLATDQDQPHGIALDLGRGHMYWVDSGAGTIRRANLDGTEAVEVITGLISPSGIHLELGEGSIDLSADGAGLSWTTPSGAERYDVVTGSLTMLRRTRGDFSAATSTCLANDAEASQLMLGDAETTEPLAQWFLIRGVGAGGEGTYESFGNGQIRPRDQAIEVSARDCPR